MHFDGGDPRWFRLVLLFAWNGTDRDHETKNDIPSPTLLFDEGRSL
jgi:hypothetical protein